MEITQTAQAGKRQKGLLFPFILILAGIVFLLERNGLVERETIMHLLPLVPIFFGGILLVSRLRRRVQSR